MLRILVTRCKITLLTFFVNVLQEMHEVNLRPSRPINAINYASALHVIFGREYVVNKRVE